MPGGKKRWRTPALVIAAVCAFLILLITLLSRPAAKLPPPLKLADGSEVKVVYAGFGKKHLYVEGNALKKLAARILPEKMAAKFGATNRSVTITNATDATVIMVRTVAMNPAPVILGASTKPSITIGQMTDDAGNDWPLTSAGYVQITSNVVIQAFRLPLVPTQAHALVLQLVQYNFIQKTFPTFRFTVLNPAPRSAPRWKARTLPQTNTVDDITVVLTSLKSTSFFSDVSLEPMDNGGLLRPESITRAQIKILRSGAPAKDLRVQSAVVADEFGNTSVFNNPYDESGTVDLRGAFSPKQAFDFQFELGPVSLFESGDAVTLTVPLPISPGTTLQSHGVQMTIDDLSQSNHFQHVALHYQISPALPNTRHFVVLKTTDASGSEIILRQFDGGAFAGGHFESNGNPIPYAATNHVDIVFGLVRRRFVDFIASPSPAAYPASAR